MSGAIVELHGKQFAIDPKESGLLVYVYHDRDELSWHLSVAAEAEFTFPDDPEPYRESIFAKLSFLAIGTRTWTDLAGRTIQPRGMKSDRLPDDPAGFYCGTHYNTDEHVFKVLSCDGKSVEVDWQFIAFDCDRGPEDFAVRVLGSIPLQGVAVHFGGDLDKLCRNAKSAEEFEKVFQRWQPDWAFAEKCLMRYFSSADFLPPIKWRGPVYYAKRQ